MITTSKIATIYFTLAIVVLGTSATLMMTAISTTAAFAQPAQQQRGGACPEGFTLNRGVCQAEPEYSCQFLLDEGFPPQRIQLAADGQQCQIRHNYSPGCEDLPDGTPLTYDIFINACRVSSDATRTPVEGTMYCDDGNSKVACLISDC